MGMSANAKNGLLAEINVTPFVDVMLVLLIIFMVTAPMLTQGLEVDLPQTRAVDTLPSESENLILTIAADGSMTLDEYEVDVQGLAPLLKRLITDQSKQLFIKADKEVPYGLVVRVMGEIKAAGIDRMGVVADPADMAPLDSDQEAEPAETNG